MEQLKMGSGTANQWPVGPTTTEQNSKLVVKHSEVQALPLHTNYEVINDIPPHWHSIQARMIGLTLLALLAVGMPYKGVMRLCYGSLIKTPQNTPIQRYLRVISRMRNVRAACCC